MSMAKTMRKFNSVEVKEKDMKIWWKCIVVCAVALMVLTGAAFTAMAGGGTYYHVKIYNQADQDCEVQVWYGSGSHKKPHVIYQNKNHTFSTDGCPYGLSGWCRTSPPQNMIETCIVEQGDYMSNCTKDCKDSQWNIQKKDGKYRFVRIN